MTPIELIRRISARVTNTYLGKFKNGTLPGSRVREYAQRAAASCPDFAIADCTAAYASPVWVLEMGKLLKGDNPHLLIIVDSLHSWAESAGAESPEYDLISEATGQLRKVAAKLNCPVLSIAERNRQSFGKGASKDQLHSGAGSRKLEYGAETVLSLEASEDKENPDGSRQVTATFAKNRHGVAGRKVQMLFNGGFQSYKES
jgi:replicative DNA helicase